MARPSSTVDFRYKASAGTHPGLGLRRRAARCQGRPAPVPPPPARKWQQWVRKGRLAQGLSPGRARHPGCTTPLMTARSVPAPVVATAAQANLHIAAGPNPPTFLYRSTLKLSNPVMSTTFMVCLAAALPPAALPPAASAAAPSAASQAPTASAYSSGAPARRSRCSAASSTACRTEAAGAGGQVRASREDAMATTAQRQRAPIVAATAGLVCPPTCRSSASRSTRVRCSFSALTSVCKAGRCVTQWHRISAQAHQS